MFSNRGNLYGVTQSGGAYDDGTAFELLPNFGGGWTESVLFSFSGGKFGYRPNSLTFGGAGKLYGTTLAGGKYENGNPGGGVVFELTP